ncbi:MAG: hypothetical protein II992_07180 [Lachnospiraceae bacterium]|nr:hypothetical protein [Lachnospiraceae bacterium]
MKTIFRLFKKIFSALRKRYALVVSITLLSNLFWYTWRLLATRFNWLHLLMGVITLLGLFAFWGRPTKKAKKKKKEEPEADDEDDS